MCVCVGVGEGYLYSAHATTRCGRKIAYVTPNINEDLKEFSREETDLHKLSLVHNTIQSILETIYWSVIYDISRQFVPIITNSSGK